MGGGGGGSCSFSILPAQTYCAACHFCLHLNTYCDICNTIMTVSCAKTNIVLVLMSIVKTNLYLAQVKNIHVSSKNCRYCKSNTPLTSMNRACLVYDKAQVLIL